VNRCSEQSSQILNQLPLLDTFRKFLRSPPLDFRLQYQVFQEGSRYFKKVARLRDITAKTGFLSRSAVVHQSLMVEEPVAIRHRR
jgi:hypothetical protein